MARISQDKRDSRGRYIKITLLTKLKRFCNFFMIKVEKWVKSLDA